MNTCERGWRHKTDGVIVRVIDYRLAAIYRLVTSIFITGRLLPGNWRA
jgi:hypothetical protein